MFKSKTFNLIPFPKIPNIFHLQDKNTLELFPHVIVKKYRNNHTFITEWKNLKKLSSLPEVPTIISVQDKYIVMTELPGKDLYTILNQDIVFPEEEIKEIIFQLLLILKKIHKKKIVHRDLKIENILYDLSSKKVHLIDFDQCLTNKCIPPENIVNPSIYRYSADLWGVGIVTYMILCKRYPWRNNRSVLYNNYVDINTSCSDSMKDFIALCLEKNYKKRMTLKKAFEHPWFSEQ